MEILVKRIIWNAEIQRYCPLSFVSVLFQHLFRDVEVMQSKIATFVCLLSKSDRFDAFLPEILPM